MSSLYAAHFQLKESPFTIAPNPRFLFMSEQHREALAHLLYGIGHDGGFVLLTGEVGTGKTTLCRCLLEKIPDDTDVAFIINPRLSVVDLLANICDELHIDYPKQAHSNRQLVDAINHYLLERHAAGRKTVLIIDEAQNLDAEVLEQLRLLTNLETDERKLLQIILLGQPELQAKLASPELRQLSQRITARYHLAELGRDDMQAYVAHRLAVAGCDRTLFTPAALRFVHRQSSGIPRLINLICDRAMLGAFAKGVTRIDRRMVGQAAREVLGEQAVPGSQSRLAPHATMLTAAVLLAVAAWASGRWMAPESEQVATPPAVASVAAEPRQAATAAKPETRADTGSGEPAVSATTDLPPPTADRPATKNPATNQPVDSKVVASTAALTPAAAASTAPSASEDAAPAEPAAQQVRTEKPRSIPPVEGGFLHDRRGAFTDLLTAWGLALPANAEPCSFAATQGLACQRISGDLGRLRSLDRPAVIDWHRDDGGMSYITVVSMGGASLHAVAGGQDFELPLEQLRQHWRDRFTILWRTPPAYGSDILPGTAGPSAKWLNQRLARLDDPESKTNPADISALYDGTWVLRLRRFQRDAGLLADGVAGPQTLIRLNNALHEPGPRLITNTPVAAGR